MSDSMSPEINNDLVTYSSNEFNVVSDGYLLKNGQVPGYIVEYINGYIGNALGNNPQINNVIKYIDNYKLEVANLLNNLSSSYSGLGSEVGTVQDLLSQFNYSLLEALSKLNIAENEYKQYLVKQINDYSSYIASINALNSSIDKSKADIINLLQTYATKDFAQSTAASVVQASLNNGAIGARIKSAETAMATQYGAMAQRVNVLESTFKDVASGVEGFATATQELQTFVGYVDGNPTGTGMLARLEIVEKQTDGILETFTGTHDVVTNAYDTVDGNEGLIATAEPYATWLEEDTDPVTGVVGIASRIAHVGDTYIQYQVVNGTNQYKGSFKFIRVDNTSFTWSKITDTEASEAMAKALEAVGLADGKSTTFVTLTGQTNLPINPQEGDLWYDARSNPATLKVWLKISSNPDKFEWRLADNQHKNFFDTIYTPTITDITKQVDSKLEYWFQDTDPSVQWTDSVTKNKHVGDVWYNTTTKTSKYYSAGGLWVLIEDVNALKAIQDAAKAQAAADGKVSNIYAYEGTIAPVNGTTTSWYSYKYYYNLNTKTLYEQTNTATGTWSVYDVNALQEGDILTTYNPMKGDYFTYYRKSGSWVTPMAGGFISTSKFATDLKSQIGDISGNVSLLVDTTTTLKDDVTTVQNQFMYNSDMTINGKKYKAGFGLRQVGSNANDGYYDSEFVINANKLKFTDGVTNWVNPFTITDDVVYANNLVLGAGNKVDWSSVEGTNKPADGATRNVNRGVWTAAPISPNYYIAGDFVQYNGSSYIAVKNTTPGTSAPNPLDTNYWQLLVKQGDNGVSSAVVSLYYVNNSSTNAPSKTFSGTFTYTFSSGSLSDGSLGGWGTGIPSASQGQYIWVSQATVTGTTTATVTASSFSSPVCISGVGLSGINTATVNLYKITNDYTVPAKVTGTFAYDFSSRQLSGGNLLGWSTSIPTIDKGQYLWIQTATASSSSLVDSIDSTEFSDPTVLSVSGVDGTDANNYITISVTPVFSNSLFYAQISASGGITYRTLTTSFASAPTENLYTKTTGTVIPDPLVSYIWTREPPNMLITDVLWTRLKVGSEYYCLKLYDGSSLIALASDQDKGLWKSSTYVQGDWVRYTIPNKGLFSFICKNDHYSSLSPDQDSANWRVVTSGRTSKVYSSIDIKINSGTEITASNVSHFRLGSMYNWVSVNGLQQLTKLIIGINDTFVKGDEIPYTLYDSSENIVKSASLVYIKNTYVPIYDHVWSFNDWLVNKTLSVSGDAIIDGTLVASSIKAGHIGTVQGVNIQKQYDPSTAITNPQIIEFASGNVPSGATFYYYSYKRVDYSTMQRKLISIGPNHYNEGSYTNYLKNVNAIASITYANVTTKPVNVLLTYTGRTGFIPTANYVEGTGTQVFIITKVVNNQYTHIFDYGWTPANQDAKAMSTFDVVPPNTTVVYNLEHYIGAMIPVGSNAYVYGADTYSESVSGTFTISGVIS